MTRHLYADDAVAPVPTGSVMIRRGLVKHCPRCGAGHLFRRWFAMKPRCPACGYRFERDDPDFWFAAYFLNMMVTQGFLCLVLAWFLLQRNADSNANILPPLITGIVLAIAVPVLFFPFSRTVWAAIDLAISPLDVREILDAEEHLDVDESLGEELAGGEPESAEPDSDHRPDPPDSMRPPRPGHPEIPRDQGS
jgi:uncharacterized protein (DUF983 family)